MDQTQLRLALHTLAINRPLLSGGPLRNLLVLLDSSAVAEMPDDALDAWAEYACSLLPWDRSLASYLRVQLQNTTNELVRCALRGETQDPALLDQMRSELAVLSEACAVAPSDIRLYSSYEGPLAQWVTSRPDLYAEYRKMLDSVRKDGFGIFRGCRMFTVHKARIVPVLRADTIRLSQLEGHEWQRRTVLRNVEALIAGKPASNMLLYGDSGTGKSSTIKAVVNDLWQEGLRLIEVRTSQLHHIPRILQQLAGNPLRFILFIDDLSFAREDSNFRALKGILEGSVVARASNVIVCATSNRRRLIRETFSDRAGDDVHANETIQQQTALSDRFGLSIPFMDPSKEEYLQIVALAAQEAGLETDQDRLFAGAERFAIEKGGRSGRVARQFVDQVVSGVIAL